MKQFMYEEQARDGEPMPQGLDLIDQCAYQALRDLSWAHDSEHLSIGEMTREWDAILHSYAVAKEKEQFRARIEQHTATLWKDIEAAADRYYKGRTLDAADAFCEAVYGVKMKRQSIDDQEGKKTGTDNDAGLYPTAQDNSREEYI